MYDCAIIGAGIGGLVCGSLLAKEGEKVCIVEKHTKLGGYVTSYSLKGFTFDVPHVIGGLKKGAMIRNIVDGIGAVVDFVELEPFQKFIYPEHEVKYYWDIEKTKQELKQHFPEDSEGIAKYYETLSKMWENINKGQPTGYENKTFENLLTNHIKNPKLRSVLGTSWGYVGMPPSRISADSMVMMLMIYHSGGAWYPKGGYQSISDAFAQAFEKYGGELILKTRVEKIVLKNGKASGIKLDNGKLLESKFVISNADTKQTLLNLVGRDKLSKESIEKLEKAKYSPSGFVVHLGVKMDLNDLDLNYGTIFFNEDYDNEKIFRAVENNEIYYGSFGMSIPSLHDESLAPEGCHCMDILNTPAPYNFKDKWLTENGKRTSAYRELKSEIANKLIASAERVIPNLSENIVVKDISTPLTYERYTFASNGCWYDLAQIPQQAGVNRLAYIDIIPNLHFTGSKGFPSIGGMAPSILCGYFTANKILQL